MRMASCKSTGCKYAEKSLEAKVPKKNMSLEIRSLKGVKVIPYVIQSEGIFKTGDSTIILMPLAHGSLKI